MNNLRRKVVRLYRSMRLTFYIFVLSQSVRVRLIAPRAGRSSENVVAIATRIVADRCRKFEFGMDKELLK